MAESGTTTDIETLIQAGNAALLAGDTFEARQRFRRATELAPENVAAWKGLAGSVRPYQEKRDYLQRALMVEPANSEIRAVLDYVEAKLAAGEVLAPRGVAVQELSGTSAPVVVDHAPGDVINGSSHTHAAPDDVAPEAILRCISCGTPITNMKGVVWTPVGQLCPDCARARRPRNYQVAPHELAIAAGVALVGSVLVSVPVVFFLGGFGFFGLMIAFIVAPFAAESIVRLLDWLTRAKRGRAMQIAVGVGIAVGAAPLLLLFQSLALLLFTIISISTAVARLR